MQAGYYLRENQIANIDKDTLYSVISEDGVPAEMFENETISYEELATIMGCDGWLVQIKEMATVYWYCPEEDIVIIVPEGYKKKVRQLVLKSMDDM